MDRSVLAAMRRRFAIAARAPGFALSAAVVAPLATAAPIDNEGFFTSLSHTLITFDVNGAGAPVVVSPGTSMSMPGNAYAPQGVAFSPTVNWVHDGNASFAAAQGLAGLAPIAIPGAGNNEFDILFSVPVRAFGMWVINNVNSVTPPTFVARGAGDVMLETVVFTGSMIDGTVGIAQYGFMGILAEQEITRVTISKQGAILDNLRFSAVPAPGAGVVALGAVMAATIRRRRA